MPDEIKNLPTKRLLAYKRKLWKRYRPPYWDEREDDEMLESDMVLEEIEEVKKILATKENIN